MRVAFSFLELGLLVPASEEWPIVVLFPLPEYAHFSSGRHAVDVREHPRPCRVATSEGTPQNKSQEVSVDQIELYADIHLEYRPLASGYTGVPSNNL